MPLMECSCKPKFYDYMDPRDGWEIERCPLCKAAPQLVELLQRCNQTFSVNRTPVAVELSKDIERVLQSLGMNP